MVTLTTSQLVLVGASGGLTALLGAVALRLAWHGVSGLITRFADRAEARRERRHHLETCRAIDALGTTNHPKE